MRMYTALALTASLCTLCALAASAQELQLVRWLDGWTARRLDGPTAGRLRTAANGCERLQ